MPAVLRTDLIATLCRDLPEPEAAVLRLLDPDDMQTHVEVYTAVRRRNAFPRPPALDDFVTGLCRHLETASA